MGAVYPAKIPVHRDLPLKMTLKHIFDYLELKCENQLLLDTVQKQQTAVEDHGRIPAGFSPARRRCMHTARTSGGVGDRSM